MAQLIDERGRPTGLFWAAATFVLVWTWAVWSCAEHWRGNPNYSYGWAVPMLALGFGVRRYLELPVLREPAHSEFPLSWLTSAMFAAAAGLAVFALEFARQEMWHPQVVLTTICFLAIAFSFAAFFRLGGKQLWRAEAFPVLFFLTALPWPARIEQPVTSTLMRWVVTATAELLHWLGVEAQTSGGAIALRSGLVGITEACSGIRSLQAGVMFGLALGEWFLLTPLRRCILLGIAVGAALLTNLARTIALSLQAEWHGVPSVEEVHDLIGNVTISALVVCIWVAGKMLSSRRASGPLTSFAELKAKALRMLQQLLTPGVAKLAPTLIACVAGLICARSVYAIMEARDHTQVVPFFTARPNDSAGDQLIPVPREIWNELRPSSGEYIRRSDDRLPHGEADFYHFFWKPSPWNRFALVHRPDICMPGVGWETSGAPVAIDIEFEHQNVRFYAFRFHRAGYHALQMWGVWRNGQPLPLDYEVAQVLGDAVPPPSLGLEGKRRSATEIVACSLFSEESPPDEEMAVALLRSVFNYKPQ
ncbi:MAG: exosortase/archaeosortase family protein [Verrucomicrobiota bacterium]|nr:exosortase/archaeosortase family protein [Verrucomicrobiota bacterium]